MCNYCRNEELKKLLDDRYLLLPNSYSGWPTVYEIGKKPIKGQGPPKSYQGKPIRFHVAFMALPNQCEC